jgi:hypothetical protein
MSYILTGDINLGVLVVRISDKIRVAMRMGGWCFGKSHADRASLDAIAWS